jgi:hypothetical protein
MADRSDPPRPTRAVWLLVRDLFFRVKLELGLRRLGIPFRVGEPDDPTPDPPALVIVDLADGALDPLRRVARLRAHFGDAPIVGYAPHGDAALREAGRRAGCAVVVSRSRLSGALPDVLQPFLSPIADHPPRN